MTLRNGLRACLTTACLASLTVTQAPAATLAEYDFEGSVSPLQSIDSDTTTDASPVSFGTAGDFTNGAILNIGEAAYIRVSNADSNLSTAISNEDYLTFSINLAAGETDFSIDQISYLHHLTDTQNGHTYNSYLFSSVNGGLTGNEIASSTFEVTPESGDSDDTEKNATVVFDAAGAGGYDSLTGSVTFWIVVTDTSTQGGHTHGIDNILVTPEPGSLALLGLGGLCVLWRRRNA